MSRRDSTSDPESSAGTPSPNGRVLLSRRALLRGLTGASAFAVVSRLTGGEAFGAVDSAATSSSSVTGTVGPLEDPIQATGRLLHGLWLPNGPALTTAPAECTAYTDYLGTTGGGHRPAIINYFRAWNTDLAQWNGGAGNPFPQDRLDNITNTGAIPMLTWEPWDPTPTAGGALQKDYKLTTLTAGGSNTTANVDSMITAWAKRCANWGKPLILRLAHEMNTPTYPWGKNNNNLVSDYVPFWRHVHDLFDAQGARNVMWAWIPNIYYSAAWDLDAGQYPGDTYVNWVGLDGYNGYRIYNSPTWQLYKNLYDYSIDKLLTVTNRSKPIMIAENGCPDTSYSYTYPPTVSGQPAPAGQVTYAADPNCSKKSWFVDFFKHAVDDSRQSTVAAVMSDSAAQPRNLRAVCYFIENKAGNWALNPTSESDYLGYQSGLGDASVGHGWGDGTATGTATTTEPRLQSLYDAFKPSSGLSSAVSSSWSGTSPQVLCKQSSTSASDTYAAIPCTATYYILTAATKYRLRGDEVYFRVRNIPLGVSSRFRLIAPATAGGSNELFFEGKVVSGEVQLTCGYWLDGVKKTPANATPATVTSGGIMMTAHRWWRIREAAGFVIWETCDDITAVAPTWNLIGSVYNLFRTSLFTVQFISGQATTPAGTPPAFEIASFNLGRKTNRA